MPKWFRVLDLKSTLFKSSTQLLSGFVLSSPEFNSSVSSISTTVLKNIRHLRRLERVFCCCSVCETMEDYKGCLVAWENYMPPRNSIFELYFKGTCHIISVTMAMHKVHKCPPNFSFCKLSEKLIW